MDGDDIQPRNVLGQWQHGLNRLFPPPKTAVRSPQSALKPLFLFWIIIFLIQGLRILGL
jgi:hypothetical protein